MKSENSIVLQIDLYRLYTLIKISTKISILLPIKENRWQNRITLHSIYECHYFCTDIIMVRDIMVICSVSRSYTQINREMITNVSIKISHSATFISALRALSGLHVNYLSRFAFTVTMMYRRPHKKCEREPRRGGDIVKNETFGIAACTDGQIVRWIKF